MVLLTNNKVKKTDDDLQIEEFELVENEKISTRTKLKEFFYENQYGKYIFKIGKVVLPFLVLIILAEILIVILNATVPALSARVLPPPHIIIVEAWYAFFPGEDSVATSLAVHIGYSFLKVLIGFAIGSLAGIIIGILMGLSKWIYRLLNPIFSLLISIPTLAWVPIMVIIFGYNDTTIILSIILGCFFPIVYSTTNGIRSIDRNLIWAARIMGANNFEIFFDVLLPGSLVSLITGLRLGIGYSWRAIIGAELLVSLLNPTGIGYFILGAQYTFNVPYIIVAIVLIALGGLLLDAVLMKPLEILTIRKWGLIEKKKNTTG